ncbi:hypothetical protein ABBQ32_006737 [Trebouxia sp. C0010 RCD-2024]
MLALPDMCASQWPIQGLTVLESQIMANSTKFFDRKSLGMIRINRKINTNRIRVSCMHNVMAADALVEVASQMKALEARVTALPSPGHSPPTAAPAPPTAPPTAPSVASGLKASTASSISFSKPVGAALSHACQAEQQQPSSAARSSQSSKAEHDTESSATGPKAAAGSVPAYREVAGRAVPGAGPEGRAVPSTDPRGRAVPSTDPQGRAVPSTDPQGRADGDASSVPDLMTFSPAVSSRPTGLNQQPAAAHLHPAGSLQQNHHAAPDALGLFNSAHVKGQKQQQEQGSQLTQSSENLAAQQHTQTVSDDAGQSLLRAHAPTLQQPKQATGGLHPDRSQPAVKAERASLGTALQTRTEPSHMVPDSRTGSPLAGGSFYNNAVFGSPTPTPSPHKDVLGLEHSLLSPGSSPGLREHQPNMHGSKPAEADSPSVSDVSVHNNQLRSHDTASISIPTTAAAASLGNNSPATLVAQPGATSQTGRRPLLAPLPSVKGGTSPAPSNGQLLSNPPTAVAEHSPGVSLNTNFHLTGQTNSLLDDSESSSADEEEVGHQLSVIQQQLARHDIDEWERDILMSEWDLLSKVRHT